MAHIVNGRVGVLAASLALAALLPNLSLAQVAREAAETRESAQALHQKAWDAYQRQQFPEALRLIERALLIEPEHADYWRFKLYALGNLERNDEVVEAASRVIVLDPDDGEAYVLRGTGHYLSGRRVEALADYRKAYVLDYRDAALYDNYLEALKEDRQYEEMKRVYARYLEIRLEDPEAIEERSDIPFNAGVAHFNTGDFRGAVALYSEAIRISPDFHGYYTNRGSARDALKEYTQALDDYARAIQWNPADAHAHYNRGVTLLTLERWADALRDFEDAHRLGQDDADVWLNIGVARDHLGQGAQALQAYDRVLAIDPGNTRARSNRVTLLRQLGRDTEAEQDKAHLQTSMPADERATLLHNESRPALDRGEFDRAIGLLRQAVALRPGMHQAWARLSEAYFGKGEIQKAIEAVNEAIRLAPDDARHYLNRGLLLIRTGDAAAGLRDYRTAERLHPDDEDARTRIALALAQAGQREEARAMYAAIERSGPKQADFHINYSAFLLEQGEYQQALRVTRSGVEKHPRHYDMRVNHANALSGTRDFEGAADAYRKAIDLGGDHHSALFNLGNLYFTDLHQPQQAIAWYQRATAAKPDHFHGWINLAAALDAASRRDDALRILGETIERFPARYEAAFNRAGMLNKMGRGDAAMADYRRALQRIDALLPEAPATPTPEQVEVMGYRAFIHYRTGNARKAVPLMARVVAFESAGRQFLRDYGYMLLDVQRPQDALAPFSRAFAEEPDEVDSWIGMMMTSYVTGNRADLSAQKTQFRERFGNRHTLDSGLLERLQADEYWYSPTAHQLWRNLIAEP